VSFPNTNHLSAINISGVLSCATLMPGGACPNGEGARQMVERGQTRLIDQYDNAKMTYDASARETSEYIDQAGQKIGDAASSLATIVQTLNDAFPELEGPNAGFKVYFPNLEIPDLRLPFEPAFPTLPDVDLSFVPSVDDIAEATGDAVTRYQQTVDHAIYMSEDDLDRLSLDFNASFELPGCGGWPCDYKPPDVDGEQAQRTVEEHEQASEEFEQSTAVSLDAFDESRNSAGNRSGASSSIFGANITASQLLQSVANNRWFKIEYLHDGGIQVMWILDRLVQLSSFAQLLDIAWRLMETVRILRKFWRRSALAIDPIDVTTDGESKSRAEKLISPLQGMAMMATHPIVVNGVLISFIMVIAYFAHALYSVPFEAYVHNCTATDAQGRPVGDGTFLTRNAYSVAFNYASHDGNRLRLQGLDEYNLARGDACARYGERSATDEQEVYSEMDLIVNAHLRTQYDVRLMRRCYNTSFLDDSFRQTPVPSPGGGTYPHLSSSLYQGSCDVELSNATLEDGVFDCARLPECELSCDSLAKAKGDETIDETQLRPRARAAMCTAQWWLHALVLRTVFSVIIWGFINMFRVVFIDGLTRVCWQWLNTGLFTFIATCRPDGSATYDKDELAQRVQEMLRRMRSIGGLYMLFACLSQIPWVFALEHYVRGLFYATPAR